VTNCKINRSRTEEHGPGPEPKRFPCQLGCGKCFVRKTDQRRHHDMASIHHPKKSWICPICGTGFNRLDNLRQHSDNRPKRCKQIKEQMEPLSEQNSYFPLTSSTGFEILDTPMNQDAWIEQSSCPPAAITSPEILDTPMNQDAWIEHILFFPLILVSGLVLCFFAHHPTGPG